MQTTAVVCFLILSLMQMPDRKVKPGVYDDPVSGLHFTYPVELTPTNEFTQQALAKSRVEAGTDSEAVKTMECLTVPLTAVENPKTIHFGVFMFSDLDLGCRRKVQNTAVLTSLVQGELQGALAKLGTPQVEKATGYKLSGYAAAAAQGIIPAEKSMSKAPIYGESACVLRLKHVFCWTAFGASRERTRQILNGQVTLNKKAETRLVPDEVTAQWQDAPFR